MLAPCCIFQKEKQFAACCIPEDDVSIDDFHRSFKYMYIIKLEF